MNKIRDLEISIDIMKDESIFPGLIKRLELQTKEEKRKLKDYFFKKNIEKIFIKIRKNKLKNRVAIPEVREKLEKEYVKIMEKRKKIDKMTWKKIHSLRIEVKYLRYAYETIRKEIRSEKKYKNLVLLQKKLGEIQDLTVLYKRRKNRKVAKRRDKILNEVKT